MDVLRAWKSNSSMVPYFSNTVLTLASSHIPALNPPIQTVLGSNSGMSPRVPNLPVLRGVVWNAGLLVSMLARVAFMLCGVCGSERVVLGVIGATDEGTTEGSTESGRDP